jgi:hypothetical protein
MHGICTFTFQQSQACIAPLPSSPSANSTMRHSVRIARIFDAANHTIVDNRLSPAVPLSIHASEGGDSGFHDLAKGPYILKGVLDKPLVVSTILSEGAALIFQYGRLI